MKQMVKSGERKSKIQNVKTKRREKDIIEVTGKITISKKVRLFFFTILYV